MATKTVHLAMPRHGNIVAGAAHGFYRAHVDALGTDVTRRCLSERPDLHVKLAPTKSSLINLNCNYHICHIRNEMRKGNAPDYFAILHSDVYPADGWLFALIEELEIKNLDILSVVVPIKDLSGLTSTAVGDLPLWERRLEPMFRLTMAEIFQLPKTFTATDCGYPGYPLLVNTGCFVCRVGEWINHAHFQVADGVLTNEDGEWEVFAESEDWYFSRRAFELGLRIGATRKIPLSHHGEFEFSNQSPYGLWKHDQKLHDRSLLRDPPGITHYGEAEAVPHHAFEPAPQPAGAM